MTATSPPVDTHYAPVSEAAAGYKDEAEIPPPMMLIFFGTARRHCRDRGRRSRVISAAAAR